MSACTHCGSSDTGWHPAGQLCHACELWRLEGATGLEFSCNPHGDGRCSHKAPTGQEGR